MKCSLIDLTAALAAAGVNVDCHDGVGWVVTLPPPPPGAFARLKDDHNNLLATLQQMGATLVFAAHNRQWRVDMPEVRALKAHNVKRGEELQVMSRELNDMQCQRDSMHDQRDRALRQVEGLQGEVKDAMHHFRTAETKLSNLMIACNDAGMVVCPSPNDMTYTVRPAAPPRYEPCGAHIANAKCLRARLNDLRAINQHLDTKNERLFAALDHAGISAKYNPVRNTWQVKNKRMSELLSVLRGNGVKVRYETNGGWKIDTNWVGIDMGAGDEVRVPVRGLMGGLFKPVRISDICKAFRISNPKNRNTHFGSIDIAGVVTLKGKDKFYGVPVPEGCGFMVNGDTEVSITVDNLRLMLMSARVH